MINQDNKEIIALNEWLASIQANVSQIIAEASGVTVEHESTTKKYIIKAVRKNELAARVEESLSRLLVKYTHSSSRIG